MLDYCRLLFCTCCVVWWFCSLFWLDGWVGWVWVACLMLVCGCLLIVLVSFFNFYLFVLFDLAD